MFSSQRLLTILFALCSISAFAHIQDFKDHGPKCAHNRYNETPELLEVEDKITPDQARLLQQTLPNIRIDTDYSQLVNGTSEFISYVKDQLLPPVIDYFEAALQIKQPLTSALKLPSTQKTICGFTTPSALFTGVNTDFYIIVSSDEDQDNWVASASTCYLSTTTKRPLIAKMLFNMIYTKAAQGDILGHEKNMYLTMHETLHALGFSGSSFKNFIDANGNTRTGHIKSVSLNGDVYSVLDVEPLTTKLRNHFGCATLPGAFMEDDGGAGTEGSHFERRHFLYETMTSGVIHGRRISEFSFAVLEGSGWYQPNYTYAEPFYFGQGEGCNFLYGNCQSSTFITDEFCSGSGRGCTNVGRGGGICTTDTRSDNCSYYMPIVDYDCENPEATDQARYPELQTFGRGVGSKCFNGNLTKLKSSTQTTFCFKYTCSGTGLSTKLTVQVGNSTAICTSVNDNPKVTGFNGNIECPDPLTFCNTVGKKYCPRNCMGRGKCVNGVCTCNTGYKGIDCALPTNW